MEKNRIALTIYLLIGLIIMGIASFLFINYIKRWALIHQQRCVFSQTEQEIAEFHRLGFAKNSELIQLLHGRMQRARNTIDTLTHTWLVLPLRKPVPSCTQLDLQNIMNLNKKMLMSYIKDIKEYKKLGITNSHAIIQFAHDKIIRLTIALAELERQLNGGIRNSLNEYTQRLTRMYEINKQSIGLFKNELHAYIQENRDAQDPKLLFLRKQLTHKTRTLQQFDTVLDY